MARSESDTTHTHMGVYRYVSIIYNIIYTVGRVAYNIHSLRYTAGPGAFSYIGTHLI